MLPATSFTAPSSSLDESLVSFGVSVLIGIFLAKSGSSTDEKSKNLELWNSRWTTNNTQWHMPKVNPVLLKFMATLNLNATSKILLPLCGKSVDLVYLSKFGIETIGVDGIDRACVEFMEENPQLEMSKKWSTLSGLFNQYVGKNIVLLKGDFFELPKVAKNTFDAVWDRASLVAINPAMRTKYVQVMRQVIKPGGRMLLSALWRKDGTPEAVAGGPPFSLSPDDVHNLYGNQDWVESIEKLDEIDLINREGGERWKSVGLTDFREVVFLIKVKA